MSESPRADGRQRLYDSHAHLVSDDLEKYPRTNPFRHGPGEQSAFGPGTAGRPGGMHGPEGYTQKPTAEQMHAWMAEEGVTGIAAVQKGMIYGTDNSYIVDAADIFPDEMRAIIIVDPQAPETPQMVRDYAKRGIIGVRFFGVGVKDKATWLSSPASREAWALANELGLLVDIEAPSIGGNVLIPIIIEMADRFPNMRIVLDHVFLPDFHQPNCGLGEQFAGFASRPNIFVKFTSINMDVIREGHVDPAIVLRAVVDFYGADKVMWGSDIGTSMGTYKEMVTRAFDSTRLLNDEERAKVLHDTGYKTFLEWKGTGR